MALGGAARARCDRSSPKSRQGLIVRRMGGTRPGRIRLQNEKKYLLELAGNPRLFFTRYRALQLKLVALEDALRESGWLKALRLEEYASRTRHRLQAVQDLPFPYLNALQHSEIELSANHVFAQALRDRWRDLV